MGRLLPEKIKVKIMKDLSKGLKALSIIFLLIGIALLIWYLCPLAARIFNVGNVVGIAGSVFLILFSVFFGKIPAMPRNIIMSFMVAFVLIIVAPVSYNMKKYANYKTDEGAETVIVLGCKVRGEVPSRFLYDRCMAAVKYLNDNPDAVVVASGGQGSGESISEAQCIENILIENGIDQSRIYKEDKSTNTAENISFSKEIIKNNNLSSEVVIVTNEFHEYRAKLYCDREQLNFHSKCSYTPRYSFLTFSTRELLGVVKYKIFG